jgi:2-phospho-L-lactate guanylyltransferase
VKVALLPVKDPRRAKQRLAAWLGPEPRERLARAMFAEVLTQLMAARGLDRVVVASSDRESLRLAAAAGAAILEESDQQSHSHSADQAARELMKQGAASLLLLPVDVPCVQSAEIEELLRASAGLPAPHLVIVPNADGTGTNAMLRTPPDLIASRFGPGSLGFHVEQARAAGAAVRVLHPPGLVHDVDTEDDARVLLARGWSGASARLMRDLLNGRYA